MSSTIDFIETAIEKHIEFGVHKYQPKPDFEVVIISYARTTDGWTALAKTTLDETLYKFEYGENDDVCEILVYSLTGRVTPP